MSEDTFHNTAWMAAMASTCMISVAPNVLLFLCPNLDQNHILLVCGQAIAAGGLLGDVFLHTLPDLFATNEEEDQVLISLCILIGFITFFSMDILVRSTEADDDGHSHTTKQQPSKKKQPTTPTKQKTLAEVLSSPLVILNLTADALHNFTDGLAIGASYAAITTTTTSSWMELIISKGGLATMTVFMHEVPHELGDYAILLNAGLTKYQAIQAQFTTALAALVGTMIGFSLGTVHTDAMVAFACGGFLYISCVTLLPEMLSSSKKTKSFSYWQVNLCSILSFVLGILFMYAVANMDHHHHHHHMESAHTHHVEHDHGHGNAGEHAHDHGHGGLCTEDHGHGGHYIDITKRSDDDSDYHGHHNVHHDYHQMGQAHDHGHAHERFY